MNDTPTYAGHTSGHAAPVLTCDNDFPAAARANIPGTRAARKVYLIAPPVSRKSAAWPRIMADLNVRIKGAPFVAFSDLFESGADYKTRWPQVIPDLAGAVVIPRPMGNRLMLGAVALREANEIIAAGKPVLIYTVQGLFQWTQAEVKVHPRTVGRWHAQLIIGGGAQ